MNDTPVPYGSPCGPSYQELQKQIKDRDETIERLVSFYKKESDFDFKCNQKLSNMTDNLLEKLTEETQLISKMTVTLVKSVGIIKHLEKKVKNRAYLTIGAVILGICATTTTGYIAYNMGEKNRYSQLEQKIETTYPASSQQR